MVYAFAVQNALDVAIIFGVNCLVSFIFRLIVQLLIVKQDNQFLALEHFTFAALSSKAFGLPSNPVAKWAT